jgi:hypothetical protein
LCKKLTADYSIYEKALHYTSSTIGHTDQLNEKGDSKEEQADNK